MQSHMTATGWKVMADGRRIRATYGMQKLDGNAKAYFSITAEIERPASKGRWLEDHAGCLHDDIAREFPNLADLIKWHLVDEDGTPMHYVANSVYHFSKIGKAPDKYYRGNPADHFRSAAVFGAVEGDTMPDGADIVGDWLARRLPALQAAFKRAMQAHHIPTA